MAAMLIQQLPCVRTVRLWVHGLWMHSFGIQLDPDHRVLCVDDKVLISESRNLAFDFTYRVRMGIWVKRGGRKVNLSYMLASVLGHKGQVLTWSFVPTEHWSYMRPCFVKVFKIIKGRSGGFPPGHLKQMQMGSSGLQL